MSLRTENKHIYWAWKSMKQRCKNPKCKAYKNYGARGIKVCTEWEKFEPFLDWCLKNGYQEGLDLDRRNNNGNYCPENCRWISRKENVNNRRNTIFLEVNGEKLPETVLSEKLGIDRALIKYWLKSGGNSYAIKRIEEILLYGYTPKDFGYSHRKKIIHIETGATFESVRQAAQHFGIAPCTISNAMKNGGKTRKGRFHWEQIG